MTYRENARGPAPRDRFWYGPFRPFLEVLGLSALFAIVAMVAVSTVRQVGRLDCERETGLCTYRRTNLLGAQRSTSFLIADVSDVRYVQGTAKQRSQGECLLVFRSGGDFRLPSQAQEAAKEQHARLQRFFSPGGEAHLSELHESSLAAKGGMIVFALVIGAVALSSFLQLLPFRVEVFHDRIWIPKQRRSIDVSRARKIVVEPSPLKPKLKRVAILIGDDVEFLSPKFQGGGATHDLAAGRLGTLLEIPVDLEGRLDDAPDSEAPASVPKLVPAESPRKIPRVAVLAGAAVALVTIVGVALTAYESRTQGTLELDCKGRCRFGGLECLPGGSLSMGLPPGTHTVETWAPDEPTHWKRNDVAIEIDQTRRFVCPPSQ